MIKFHAIYLCQREECDSPPLEMTVESMDEAIKGRPVCERCGGGMVSSCASEKQKKTNVFLEKLKKSGNLVEEDTRPHLQWNDSWGTGGVGYVDYQTLCGDVTCSGTLPDSSLEKSGEKPRDQFLSMVTGRENEAFFSQVYL